MSTPESPHDDVGADARRALEEAGRLPLVDPPADLWSRIETRLGDGPAAEPECVRPERPPDRMVGRGATRRLAGLAAAAAVVAVVGIGAMLALRPSGSPEPVVLGEATLTAVGGGPAGGHAAVHRTGVTTELVLQLDDVVAPPGSELEVWLLRPDVTAMRSLGTVAEGGTYPVPEDVDLGDLSVVDVSVEPLDGDPSHSGDSVLRGRLPI